MEKVETHPFESFIPENITTLIVGSFPGRGQTKEDWYYGAQRNQFWKIISAIYDETELHSKEDKQRLFRKLGIGVTDILLKIVRKKDSALDKYLDIKEYNYESIKSILINQQITTILFTSKFVESHFLMHFPDAKSYACLPSPSGGANIPISKSEEFKNYKIENPDKNTIDFRVYKYKQLLKVR